MPEHLDGAKRGQHDERAGGARTERGETPAPASDVAAAHRALHGLQRSAGNAAVAGVVQRADWRDIADPLGVTSAMGGLVGLVRAGALDQGQFKRDVYAARQRPIWRAEWDAWGHAVCGACSASFGGEGHAWAFGAAHEGISELLRAAGVSEHDSYREDTHNQAVGRGIAQRLGAGSPAASLINACTQAYLSGELLVGPDRHDAWVPGLGDNDFAEARRHEDAYWVPTRPGGVSSSPAEWIEAVDPGERGAARGTGRHPSSVPADS